MTSKIRCFLTFFDSFWIVVEMSLVILLIGETPKETPIKKVPYKYSLFIK